MEKHGLKQYELAALAGISQGHFSSVMHAKYKSINSISLTNLAKVLNTSVDYLIGASDDPRAPKEVPVGALTADEEELVRVYRQIHGDLLKEQAHVQLRVYVELERQVKREAPVRERPGQSDGQEDRPRLEDAPVGWQGS
jgi:transcriptional regulator with XRE-family HTH domain